MNSSCEGADLPLPDYFSYRYRVIGTFFQGIIFVIGVLGNATVVIVVSKVRSLRTPTNCYLVSLAVADSVVLVASVPNEISSYYLVGNRWLWGEVGCRLIIFFQNLGINASSLSLIAFTVERYIAICHPMKAHKMCTLGRAKRIILGVWAFACVYCSPWMLGLTTTRPLHYRGQPAVKECIFQLPRNEYLAVFFTDLVVFYVIPLIVSCILYYLITRSLCTEVQLSDASNAINIKSHRNGSKAQVVKMLAVVVLVFALLWLPYRGMLVYNSFASLLKAPLIMDLWFLMFAKTCVYINSAINPFLYNMMSTNFRQAFHRVLLGRPVGSRRNRTSFAPSTLSTQTL